MKTLVFATTNKGKLAELTALLGSGWAVLSAADFPSVPEVIEDGFNGFLRPYGDIDAWVALADEIVRNPKAFAHIRKNAEARGRDFLVEAVAEGATFLTVARLRSAAFAEGAMSAELKMTRPRMEAMRLTAVRKRCCIQVLQT